MKTVKTLIIGSGEVNPEAALRAAEILYRGGTGLIPTETVYGLCAHPQREEAARKLYELKGRDYGKPFQILISDMSVISRFALDIPHGAFQLVRDHWPGPLTIVLKGLNGGTVGLRMPDHPVALELIRLCGGALCATSANLSGMAENTSFLPALRSFDSLVDVAIDGGDCARGGASTVISYAGDKPVFIRRSAYIDILP